MNNDTQYIYYVSWYGQPRRALFPEFDDAMEYVNKKMALGFISNHGETYKNEIINIGTITIEEESKECCLLSIFRSMKDGKIINKTEGNKQYGL